MLAESSATYSYEIALPLSSRLSLMSQVKTFPVTAGSATRLSGVSP